ncbi:MAG: serine/threonine protein [Planctomycetota bacterium]|nr:MAG: serine/threonine protein [Planctomycetota bacterium]
MSNLTPGAVIGKCKIVRELGRGGMGAVYLARHLTLNVDVAIKVLPQDISLKSPDYAARFLREARVAAALRHPNVVAIMDADRDAETGLYYIVEEFVDGGSLRERLQAKGAFTEKSAIAATAGILKALQAAMKKGIVHRDIKPDNILVTKDGQVKLADLGLAKRTGNISSAPAITQAAITMGTPHYMSPEQIEDTSKVDIRGDIYSLGATFYHLLALSPPFGGNEIYAVLNKVMNSPAPDIRVARPDVSEGTARVIQRMLEKKAENRYQSPADVLADLAKGGPGLELMPEVARPGAAALVPATGSLGSPLPALTGSGARTPGMIGTPGQMVPSDGPVDLTTPLPGAPPSPAAQKAVYVIAGCCVLLLFFAMRMMMKSGEEIPETPKKTASTEDQGTKPPDPGSKPPDPAVKPPDPVVKPPDPVVKPPDPVVKPPDPVVTPPVKAFALDKGCLLGYTFEPDTEDEIESGGDTHRGWQDLAASRYFAISIQVVTGEGRVGKGAAFNGTSAYLSLPPLPQRTVAAWLKPSKARSMVWYDGGKTEKLKGFIAGLSHPDREMAGRGEGAFLSFVESGVVTGARGIFEGWHHLAVVWDGDRSVRIAVDGVLNDGFVLKGEPGGRPPRPTERPELKRPPFTLPEKPAPEAEAITIGRSKLSSGQAFSAFAGAMDELAIWDRALTDDELKQLPEFAANGKSYVQAIADKNSEK